VASAETLELLNTLLSSNDKEYIDNELKNIFLLFFTEIKHVQLKLRELSWKIIHWNY